MVSYYWTDNILRGRFNDIGHDEGSKVVRSRQVLTGLCKEHLKALSDALLHRDVEHNLLQFYLKSVILSYRNTLVDTKECRGRAVQPTLQWSPHADLTNEFSLCC